MEPDQPLAFLLQAEPVGRVGVLGLEPGTPTDDFGDRPTLAVEQTLAGQGRPIQRTD
jgi:hypothetical protein